jgi:hypothetical protein
VDIQIYLSLTAQSADQLSTATVDAQLFWGMKLTFFDFQVVGGKHICWFTVPFSIWQEKRGKK